MLSVRKVLLPAGVFVLAGWSSASAQGLPAIPAVPGAAPAVVAPADPGPGILGRFAIRFDAFRRRIALTPVGQLLANAKKPLAGLTGGLIGNPVKPNDKEAAAPGAGGAAAAGKKDAAEAKKRREDVAYLGTLDCRYYPNASQALADALRTDPSECVRWEAAIALSKSCCCNNTTVKALMASVSGMDSDGNPAERSARVRCTAAVALERCLACYTPPYEEPEQQPKTPPALGEKPEIKGEGDAKKPSETAPPPKPADGDGRTTNGNGPSPKLVRQARETLAEFQQLMAVSAPRIQSQIDPPQKSVVHVLQASFAAPAGAPSTAVAPLAAPTPAPVTVARTAPRAAAPVVTRTEAAITPAAALSPKFVPEVDDAAVLKAVSARCLNAADVPGQHQAIRELVRYDSKAQPLVAATLLYGAKATQFREEVRVDCVRMLAANAVAHAQVIDGLTGLAGDPSQWVRQEASKALASLTPGR